MEISLCLREGLNSTKWPLYILDGSTNFNTKEGRRICGLSDFFLSKGTVCLPTLPSLFGHR